MSHLGVSPITDPIGEFGPSTRAAVELFQRQRGLRIDGIVGRGTWSTLVEAGLHLGSRLLYRTQPMQRGDDVAELQSRLCSLGFDTGRVDGIFGDATAQAVAEFQRNIQLPTDAMAGALTIDELVRVSARHQTLALVTTVREAEARREQTHTLRGSHVGIGEGGGLSTVAGALHRQLASHGARVTLLSHPDESAQAVEANQGAVDLYVGLRLVPATTGCTTAFYSGYSYESVGGRLLAEEIAQVMEEIFDDPTDVRGMTLPVLRETRMPAVVVEIGPLEIAVERSGLIAEALARAIVAWATAADAEPPSSA